jgi:hypothetical protein
MSDAVKPPSKQQMLNMPAALWVYVDDLRQTGLYGPTFSAVVRSLVADGVQAAIGNRLIGLRRFETPEDDR